MSELGKTDERERVVTEYDLGEDVDDTQRMDETFPTYSC